MKKLYNNFKENCLFWIIVIQPLLDILSFFLVNTIFSKISLVIRGILLLFVIIFTFFNCKNKKQYFILMIPWILYFFLHVFNSFRLNSFNTFADLKYILIILQIPIFTISFIYYLKENYNKIDNIKNGIIISFVIIFISFVLSFILGNYNLTYIEGGIIGWFNVTNTQCLILTAITPLFLFYLNLKFNNKLIFVISSISVFIILFFNGTKTCYLTLIVVFVLMLYNLIFSKIKKNKIFKIVFNIIILISVFGFFKYSLTYQKYILNEANNDEYETVINDNKIPNKDSNLPLNNENTIDKENVENINKNETDLEFKRILNILNSSYLYKNLMDIHGENLIVEKMKNDIDSKNLFDNRLVKRINAEIEFSKSDILTKFIGLNYSIIAVNSLDMENDITAIFYYFGYLGFALLFFFVFYFLYNFIKLFFNNFKIIFDGEFVFILITLLLLLFGSEFSGGFLRKANANIYFSLLLTLIFYFKKVREK